MADAALRMNDQFGSDIVRRLVARPIRVDGAGMSSTVAAMLATAEPEADASEDQRADGDRDAGRPAADVSRLRAEVMVMKAALRSERDENARLRAHVTHVADAAPISDEARATRDRWAALVDHLLRSPR